MLSLRRRDIVCQQAVELVTDYLEGALSRRDRRRFEAHIRACPNCTAYLEQIRTIIALTGSIEPDDLTPEAEMISPNSTGAGDWIDPVNRSVQPDAVTHDHVRVRGNEARERIARALGCVASATSYRHFWNITSV